MTGADIKATKVVYEMSKEVNIRIAGDHNPERSAKVVESVGQGTQVAPKGSGLSIGLAVDKNVELEKCDKINGKVPVGPRVFVDDAIVPNKSCEDARDNGKKVSGAMEVLSLTANHVKSSMLVT